MATQRDVARRFAEAFDKRRSDVHLTLQREVFGGDAWVNGYTTPQQADLIARCLELRASDYLLDLGSGYGWPALRLVEQTGCRAVLTDAPLEGLRQALRRAERMRLAGLCAFARVSGTHLPFRSRIFDTVVHTDTL